MHRRYAIYYAPATDSTLWQRACQWIGRDAACDTPVPVPDTLRPVGGGLETLTTSPRRYGFHATLKAPMHLAPDQSENALIEGLDAFAAHSAPVSAGPMAPQLLGGFLALMPVEQGQELTGFAGRCVTEFDRFRAPLRDEDWQKRLNGGLTRRQTELVGQYGYPYVLEEFRMHMTLTNRMSEPVQQPVRTAAEEWFADALKQPLTIDRLALYVEDEPGTPFVRMRDFVLRG